MRSFWLFVLYAITVLSALAGAVTLLFARSAIHEILTAICWLTFAVAAAGITVTHAIGRLDAAMRREPPNP